MKGVFTGLNVINKSGMTGEGSYLQMRGVKSLFAENSPLIVINGVPYIPDLNESPIVSGFPNRLFRPITTRTSATSPFSRVPKPLSMVRSVLTVSS